MEVFAFKIRYWKISKKLFISFKCKNFSQRSISCLVAKNLNNMKLFVLSLALLSLYQASALNTTTQFTPVPRGVSGTGTTTRYWDCCKPSCAWVGNTGGSTAIASCAADGSTVIDDNTQSGCVGGSAYMCSNQSPWVVSSNLAYGFAAASIPDGGNICCICVLWSFQGDLAGKQMLVQITNTGADAIPGINQFDIALPGGGVGYYTDGCSSQWGAPSGGWGDQYGGVNSEAECDELPTPLQAGCKFRFTFLEGVSNPNVDFTQVECPSEIVSISGCKA